MPKNLEISLLFDFYGQMLTDKQREAVEFYYNEDLSLAEIAQQTGITRQGVRDNIKRAEAQLLEYEENLGLFARFHSIQSQMEIIVTEANSIKSENQNTAKSREIDLLADNIIALVENINN